MNLWVLFFLMCCILFDFCLFFGILSFVVDLNNILFDGLRGFVGEVDFVIGLDGDIVRFFNGLKSMFVWVSLGGFFCLVVLVKVDNFLKCGFFWFLLFCKNWVFFFGWM